MQGFSFPTETFGQELPLLYNLYQLVPLFDFAAAPLRPARPRCSACFSTGRPRGAPLRRSTLIDQTTMNWYASMLCMPLGYIC